jgi:hypothetical protein
MAQDKKTPGATRPQNSEVAAKPKTSAKPYKKPTRTVTMQMNMQERFHCDLPTGVIRGKFGSGRPFQNF